MSRYICLAALVAVNAWSITARVEGPACDVRARTSAGWVCGARRWADDGRAYASFTAVPYAKQPTGERRFKELEPLEPWSHLYDATKTGDICPQNDVFYGPLMKPRGMSESCIHANIYVPIDALPGANGRPARELKPPAAEALETSTGLPILVFIHGGGFAFGSGDPDVYGPEYLVSKGVIVITFNYRLNVLGFLSLNTSKVPGNAGLRDMVTLLRWVRDNARNFGGNPEEVTLGGQSAGAASAHLLTLSPEANGLFKRTILMSGSAVPMFYTTSPAYAKFIANTFVAGLGINSTDPDEIHQALIDMPLEKLVQMDKILLTQFGLGVFYPVIDAGIPGVKPILPEDTETMQVKGHGKHIPLLIGYTNKEAETFKKVMEEINIVSKVNNNPLTVVPLSVTFSNLPEVALQRAKKIDQRYFNETLDIENYLQLCTDMYFEYPALKVAKYRQQSGALQTFLYRFSYDALYSPIKIGLGLNFTGAGHVEDMTHVFRVNSAPRSANAENWDDDYMQRLMMTYVLNFIHYGHPTGYDDAYDADFAWKSIGQGQDIQYQVLHSPRVHHMTTTSPRQHELVEFFDSIVRS